MTPKKSINEYPQGYSHLERACGMMNLLIDRAELPNKWKVPLPLGAETKSWEPVAFGVSQAYLGESQLLEGFMLGMAIASGSITIGKCREWLMAANAHQPHELANFGGAIRDVFAKEDESVVIPKRRKADAE